MWDIETRSKIALLGGAFDWKTTPIGGNDGILADARRFLQPNWWNSPRDTAGRELSSLLQRAGLGRLVDMEEHEKYRESGKGPTVAEIAESQRDKRRREDAGDDEEPQGWQEYLPGPEDDVRAWYENFAKRVDVNTPDRRSWFSALGSYIGKFTPETKASELDENVVGMMVKMICEEAAA